ncbi:MAG: DNA repair protein RadC [Synergistota bacterium]|jgi:DNA repair protein RadC|nr:DNA repair protein RadC [Synergistota bacterium]
MTEDQLPRERLFSNGATALNDVELLAILLRTGGGGEDVLGLSESILDGFGGLGGLTRASVKEYLSFKGIGAAKAASLAAAVEIGRRLAIYNGRDPSRPLSWRDELRNIQVRLSDEPREFIVAIFLGDRERFLSKEMISFGGPDGASLDIRHFMRVAVRLDAYGVVLVHNHPDGSLESSAEDRTLTRIVRERLDALGIRFHGHYIVSRLGIAAVE